MICITAINETIYIYFFFRGFSAHADTMVDSSLSLVICATPLRRGRFFFRPGNAMPSPEGSQAGVMRLEDADHRNRGAKP